MILTLTLLILSLATVWAVRNTTEKETNMYHMMSPERAADLYADDWADEDRREQEYNESLDAALDDFTVGLETAPLEYEIVQDHLIDEGRLFTLIELAWRHDDFTQLGEHIRFELNRAAEKHLDEYRP